MRIALARRARALREGRRRDSPQAALAAEDGDRRPTGCSPTCSPRSATARSSATIRCRAPRQAFAEQVKRARTRLPAVAEGAFRLLAAIAAELPGADAAARRAAAPSHGRFAADMRAQRDALVHPGILRRDAVGATCSTCRATSKALDRRARQVSSSARTATRGTRSRSRRWWQRYRERADRESRGRPARAARSTTSAGCSRSSRFRCSRRSSRRRSRCRTSGSKRPGPSSTAEPAAAAAAGAAMAPRARAACYSDFAKYGANVLDRVVRRRDKSTPRPSRPPVHDDPRLNATSTDSAGAAAAAREVAEDPRAIAGISPFVACSARFRTILDRVGDAADGSRGPHRRARGAADASSMRAALLQGAAHARCWPSSSSGCASSSTTRIAGDDRAEGGLLEGRRRPSSRWSRRSRWTSRSSRGNITRVVENLCHDELQLLNRGIGYLLGQPDLETDGNPLAPGDDRRRVRGRAAATIKTETRIKFQILKELNQASLAEINAIYARPQQAPAAPQHDARAPAAPRSTSAARPTRAAATPKRREAAAAAAGRSPKST